ncbi:MAG: hypothetical protein AAF334_08990 [Pseudomonadota bacterium]
MSLEITRDPRNRRGGWALIRVSAQEGAQTSVSVRRDEGEFSLGPHGWQGGAHAFGPYTVETDRRGTFVRIGPEIVNHMEEYLTAEIRLPELGLAATLPWPDEILPAPDAFEGGGVAARGPEAMTPAPVARPAPQAREEPTSAGPTIAQPPPPVPPVPTPAAPIPAAPSPVAPAPVAPTPVAPPPQAKPEQQTATRVQPEARSDHRPAAPPSPKPQQATPDAEPPSAPKRRQAPGPRTPAKSLLIPFLILLLLAAASAAGTYYYLAVYLPDQLAENTDDRDWDTDPDRDPTPSPDPEPERDPEPEPEPAPEQVSGPTRCTEDEVGEFLSQSGLSAEDLRPVERLCADANAVDLRIDVLQSLLDLEDAEALLQWARWHDPARDGEPSPLARDPLTAADYYKRAKAAGSPDAAEALDQLCTQLETSSDPLASSLAALHCQ